MRYPVFLINLDRQPGRLRFMQAQLGAQGITPIRFPAVNGRDPAERARADVASYAQLTPGEIGCFESHRRLWQKMVDEGIEAAYALEDDMVVSDDFAQITYPDEALAQIDVIKVDFSPGKPAIYGTRALEIAPGRGIVRQLGTEISTGCYFITRRGAEKLLKLTANYMLPVDTMMFNAQSTAFGHLSVWKISPAAATQLSLAGEMNEPGAMHADFFDRIQGAARPERERGLKASWRRLRVRLRRLLDRDTATLRRDRARARVAAFRESEPVSEQEIPFEGGTLAHYHAARAAEAGSGQ